MESVYYNQEAEMSVIGMGISYPGDCLRKVCELPPGAMYFDADRELLECLKAMEREKAAVDLITVNSWITQHQKGEVTGGAAYTLKCAQLAIGPSFMEGHLKIIRECHSRRVQREMARDYIRKLDSGETPEDCREWMTAKLAEVKEYRNNGLVPLSDAALMTYEQLAEEQESDDKPTRRILSGISTMDNKLGGLMGSEYVAIGARPSVGKSIFALTYCVNAAKQGKRVLLVSLEMNEIDITERIFARETGVTMGELVSGHMTDEGWQELAGNLQRVSDLPLWFSTEADTVEKVRRCAYELFENGGVDLIAVDYIQLMEAPGSRRQNRQEQISEISRGLRRLASELKIPILVLTQLNRTSAKGQMIKGKKVRQEPTMSEARESGAIEQDANIFMLLHDPDETEMRNEEEKEVFRNLKQQGYQMMRIIIDKNRQSKRGRVTLAFDGDHMRFLPIARSLESPW